MKHWYESDLTFSRFMMSYTQQHPYFSFFLTIFHIIPYHFILNLTIIISLLFLFINGSFNNVKMILFPYFFVITCTSYLERNIFRSRPACRYNKYRKNIDPIYCNDINSLNSTPSKEIFIMMTMCTTIGFYLFHNSNPFLKSNDFIKYIIIGVSSTMIILSSIERIAHGYNYLSDIILSLIFGYILGYTCFHLEYEINSSIQWIIIRIIGCLIIISVMIRFLLFYLPHIFKKTTISIRSKRKNHI